MEALSRTLSVGVAYMRPLQAKREPWSHGKLGAPKENIFESISISTPPFSFSFHDTFALLLFYKKVKHILTFFFSMLMSA